MKEQTRLEQFGNIKRDEAVIKNDYAAELLVNTNEKTYREEHPDAISDGDPLGKGSKSGGIKDADINDRNSFYIDSAQGIRVQKMSYDNIRTKESETQTIGGSYDRYGASGVAGAFQGKAGRENLKTMNRFCEGKEYGENSIDTDNNILIGQYRVN